MNGSAQLLRVRRQIDRNVFNRYAKSDEYILSVHNIQNSQITNIQAHLSVYFVAFLFSVDTVRFLSLNFVVIFGK